MGDIAEWILEGGCCQICGAIMEDYDEPGYPRSCPGCEAEEE